MALPGALTSDAFFYALLVLVVIGALNWLMVALFDFDLVVAITRGDQPKVPYKVPARVVYGLVGAAAVMLVVVVALRRR